MAYIITGSNTVAFCAVSSTKRLAIPSSVEYEGTTYSVTSIVADIDAPGLVSVVIPSTVTSLAKDAFTGCTGLKKVTFLGNTAPTGIADAFNFVSGRQTYVSASVYNSYASVLGTVNVYSNLNTMFESGGVFYIPQPSSRTAVAYDCDYSTANIVVPSVVNYRNVDLNVTSVCPQTFLDHNTLTGVEIGGVSSIGADAFTGCSSLTQLTLHDAEGELAMSASLSGLNVKTLTINRNVVYSGTSPFANMTALELLYVLGHATTIRTADFTGASNLSTLGVGGTVAQIGQDAFSGLTKLKDISLDGNALAVGKNAFANCTALSNVTIESSVASLGEGAFINCSAINRLTINSGLTTIGDKAFENCTGIQRITLPNTVATIGDRAFYGCNGINTAVRVSNTRPTIIGSYAFYGCSSVPSFTVGNGTTTIGSYAFSGCTGASAISLGSGITSIGDYAFSGCSAVSALNLNSGITAIGKGAFKNCTSLTSLTVPANITQLADELVSGCTALSSLSVSNQLTAIGAQALKDTPQLSDFPIPATVAAIGTHAFDGCGVQQVSLPAGITYIDEGVFANTASLQSINLNKVTEIREEAFANSVLPALTIPAGVLTIKNRAFNGCASLADLTIAASTRKLTLGYNEDSSKGLFANCGLVNLSLDRDLTYEGSADKGYSPFYGNTSLRTVAAAGNCTAIDQNMFRNCTGLSEVALAPSITAMGAYAFAGSGVSTINFPAKLTYIATHAFDGCPNLAIVEVPRTITRIDSYAFAGSGITTISIPASVQTVSEYMLANTKKLQTVTLADGVTAIAPNAFSGSALPAISIPSSVVNVGNGAFSGCTSLADVNIADGSDQLSLGYNKSGQGLFYDCHLNTVYIGRNLKYSTSDIYGTSPFYGNQFLTAVTVGDLPSQVATKAFYNCTALTDVRLGDSVGMIGDFAFSGCTSLDKFSVGAAVEEIGANAFSDCTMMTEFYSYAAIPPYCGEQALDDIDKFQCYLFVPETSTDDYGSADQWCEFFFVEGFDAGVNVSYIELSQTTATLNIGETLQLSATAYPETALLRSVDWSSTDNAVASVNAQGIVTAYAEGRADIVATAKDGSGVTAVCTINVFNPNKPVDYALTPGDITISGTGVVNMPVRMTNAAPAITFGCRIAIPEGLEIMKDDNGLYAFAKGDRMNVHLMAAADDNGAVNVLSYSMTNTPYADGDVLFYIPLRLTNPDLAAGTELTVSITNVLISNTDFDEFDCPDASATVTVGSSYTPGDVNNDGRITPVDIAFTVAKVLGGSPNNFSFAAADMNQDGRITPVDIARIVSIILGGSNRAPQMQSADIPQSGEYARLAIPGNGTLMVGLSGVHRFTAAQLDVELPFGVSVENAALSVESNHVVRFSLLDDGRYRVLIYSLANDNIPADAELRLTLSGTGSGNIAIDNILASERLTADDFEEYTVASDSLVTTGFDLCVAEAVKVIPTADGVTITSPCDTTITLCDTLGRARTIAVKAGVNTFSLESGVYLLGSQKIVVR